VTDRQQILTSLRAKIADSRPVIGSGAGIGLSAVCAEAADLDFVVVYNSGRYRMAGRSSMAGLMPYGDANAIVTEMAEETLATVSHIPVVAGVCATDPFRIIPRFLRQLKEMGCSGVQNYPTVCLFDGVIRAHLEETGLGFDKEVEMIAEAHALDLLTVAYVASEAEAKAMAAAGADILVAHMGLTTAGLIGAKTSIGLDEAIQEVDRLGTAGREANPEVIVICHGGPISGLDDVARVLAESRFAQGFLGASSMERLPTEVAMINRMNSFTLLPLRSDAPVGQAGAQA
jgi:predicted TIM-barrel enzyme